MTWCTLFLVRRSPTPTIALMTTRPTTRAAFASLPPQDGFDLACWRQKRLFSVANAAPVHDISVPVSSEHQGIASGPPLLYLSLQTNRGHPRHSPPPTTKKRNWTEQTTHGPLNVDPQWQFILCFNSKPGFITC
ncbi:hypothetical protein O3P69_016076 [Scylla paramamosain]|uniref:Uncharacterized protein n=1 Tax=Scylla paramamosain TaxID=85552 RepID=A0AAW0TA06_SCYPA